MKPRYYIGLAATYHDPAIAIVGPDGNVLFAEAAERFLQDKRAFNAPPDHMIRAARLVEQFCSTDAELVLAVSWERGYIHPMRAVTELSQLAQRLGRSNVDGAYTWPWPTLENQMLAMTASITLAGQNIRGNRAIRQPATIRYYDHHLCHAATACYSSPFASGSCAVIDGHGGTQSCAFYTYDWGSIKPLKRGLADGFDTGSLGQFYALICNLCGFDSVQGEEWKVMGLASYGKFSAEWYERLLPLVRADGPTLKQANGPAFLRLLEDLRRNGRQPGQSAMQFADLAYTGQHRFCEVARDLLVNLHSIAPSANLILGGGCALNSSWNGRIVEETPFKSLHVPMAPGDDGNALGAAWLAFHEDHPGARPLPEVHSPSLGSTLSTRSLDHWRRFNGREVNVHSQGLHARAAQLLAEGNIVGWARGRAEFGPRALGNRSILADPRSPEMMHTINERVKFREEFRPFAPSVLHEYGPAYFENYQASPYMERTLRFRLDKRKEVPAVVHVDGTGRLQSVRKETAPDFYKLIDNFRELTGVPILLNTSFNVMGKPIVHSVEDAIGVFYTTGLDALVLEDHLLVKERKEDRKGAAAVSSAKTRRRPKKGSTTKKRVSGLAATIPDDS
jgi:carbamoyltransferase